MKIFVTLLLASFTQIQYDPSLFLCQSAGGVTIFLVYVDDIIIFGDVPDWIFQLQQSLHASFHMKGLGPLAHSLSLEVHKTKGVLFINQHKYTQDLIANARLQDISPVDTPLELNVKCSKDDGTVSDATVYRKLDGSLIYLTITSTDIFHAVNLLSEFMTKPSQLHFTDSKESLVFFLVHRNRASSFLKIPISTSLHTVMH